MTTTTIHLADSMLDYPRGRSPAGVIPNHRQPIPSSAPQMPPAGQYHHQPQPQSHQTSYGYPARPRHSQSPPIENQHQPNSSSPQSHLRTTISSVQPHSVPSPSPPNTSNPNRRFSSSANGFSNNKMTSAMPQAQYHVQRSGTNTSTTSNGPRRSTSSRSSTLIAPTSYVALMRKQKATVWCDRSQTLDPHAAAALKAAKHRAALEVHGGGAAGRTSTLNSGKKPSTKAPTYIPANLSGVSVPVRLSANETLGDEDEEAQDGRNTVDGSNATARLHNRSGSGKSSTHSAKYPSGYPRSNQGGRFSTTGTPPLPNESFPSPEHDNHHSSLTSPNTSDYFARTATHTSGHSGTSSTNNNHVSHSANQSSQNLNTSKTNSPDTEEDRFGDPSELRSPNRQSAVAMGAEQARHAEELRRRGSVDERTMTMSMGLGMGGKGRLFVANPDLDD